jgi:hypothetical protein
MKEFRVPGSWFQVRRIACGRPNCINDTAFKYSLTLKLLYSETLKHLRMSVVTVVALALLSSCADALSFRYSSEAVDSLQARNAIPLFDKTAFDSAAASAEFGNASGIFFYGPERPFIAPAGPRQVPGGKARLSKNSALPALFAAFEAEGIYAQQNQLLEFENVSVTLDGFSEADGTGFIFITPREMRKGPFGSYVGGRPFIDPAEVFALQKSGRRILIVSQDDPRFMFDAGLDTAAPPLGVGEILANRDAAAKRLYDATRMWIRSAK